MSATRTKTGRFKKGHGKVRKSGHHHHHKKAAKKRTHKRRRSGGLLGLGIAGL